MNMILLSGEIRTDVPWILSNMHANAFPADCFRFCVLTISCQSSKRVLLCSKKSDSSNVLTEIQIVVLTANCPSLCCPILLEGCFLLIALPGVGVLRSVQIGSFGSLELESSAAQGRRIFLRILSSSGIDAGCKTHLFPSRR